jgi:branched-chain amino acid transport system permease protein
MTVILQWLITGLCVGLVYAMFSAGYSLMFGVMRCLNVAHAGVFMLCALIACKLSMLPVQGIGLHAVIVGGTVLAGVLLSVAVHGLALHYMLRPGANTVDIEMGSFLSTLGALFIIESAAVEWSDARAFNFNFDYLKLGSANIVGVVLPLKYLAVGAAAVVSLLAMDRVLRSSLGRRMRATADSRLLATVMGVNVRRTQQLSMVIAGALAGLAGLMIAYLYGQATIGLSHTFLLKAIVIGIVAGLGSVTGAMVVALLVGVLEAATVNYLGSGWRDISLFVLVIIVLAVRPQGVFHREQRAAT